MAAETDFIGADLGLAWHRPDSDAVSPFRWNTLQEHLGPVLLFLEVPGSVPSGCYSYGEGFYCLTSPIDPREDNTNSGGPIKSFVLLVF